MSHMNLQVLSCTPHPWAYPAPPKNKMKSLDFARETRIGTSQKRVFLVLITQT